MNLDHTILTLITFTPLAGALVLALLPDRDKLQPWAALAVSLLTFGLTLHLPTYFSYSAAHPRFQFEANAAWIASPAIGYHLGVDGLSMWLVVLSGLLGVLGVLGSWNAVASRRKLFYILLLLQQTAILGVFVSLDLFLYYAFWEMTLVPMAILIATFGRTANRRRAGIRYFLYAFIPSAILLVGMLWLYARTGTFDYVVLERLAAQHAISLNSSALLLASLAFLVAFAVKVPIFPLHGWLVDAVAEAPTAAVIVLTGKLGLYSILRFSFGLFPEQSRHLAPLMIALGAIGIVYGSLLALTQNDLKRFAAYATLGALSFVTLGSFSFTISGIDGGIFHILSESLSGAALFLLLGFLYERYASYDMRDFGGLAGRLPWTVTFFVIMGLSVVGLPMLNNFVGEFLILSGAMKSVLGHHLLWTVVGTSGVILSAAYMLSMIQRVFYGELGFRPAELPGAPDLSQREHLALWPLAVLFTVLGLASPLFMRAIDPVGVRLAGTLPQPQPAASGLQATANCANQVDRYQHSLPVPDDFTQRAIVPGEREQDEQALRKQLIAACEQSPDHTVHAQQPVTRNGFVDPDLAAAASGRKPAPALPGARY